MTCEMATALCVQGFLVVASIQYRVPEIDVKR